jgi:hypothetical protein
MKYLQTTSTNPEVKNVGFGKRIQLSREGLYIEIILGKG